jgi:hypothetical protein
VLTTLDFEITQEASGSLANATEERSRIWASSTYRNGLSADLCNDAMNGDYATTPVDSWRQNRIFLIPAVEVHTL